MNKDTAYLLLTRLANYLEELSIAGSPENLSFELKYESGQIPGICDTLQSYVLQSKDSNFLKTAANTLTAPSFNDYSSKKVLNLIKFIEESKKINEFLELSNDYFPKELDTDRARKYFPKAIQEGLIRKVQTGYEKVNITKALLAYFLEMVFCRNDEGKDNNVSFPETALELLFRESRLGKARSQYLSNKKTKGKPNGHERIDNIFD